MVPHQLFTTVAVVRSFQRFAVPGKLELFPAKRLKLMFKFPAPGLSFPIAMPPPFPVLVFPVIVALLRVTTSVHAAGQPLLAVLMYKPPPPKLLVEMEPELFPLMTDPWSSSRFEESQI